MRHFLCFLLLSFSGPVRAQPHWLRAEVSGGTAAADKVYLGVYEQATLRAVDSVSLNGQSFFAFRHPPAAGMAAVYIHPDAPLQLVYGGGKSEAMAIRASAAELRRGVGRSSGSAEQAAFEKLETLYEDFRQRADSLSRAGSSLPEFDPAYSAKSAKLRAAYEEGCKDFNAALTLFAKAQPGSFAADVLVPLRRIALRTERAAWMAEYDNNRSFQHYEYFAHVPFGDARILRTPLLKQRYEEYLELYVARDSAGYREGAERIMKLAAAQPAVRDFTLGFLLGYFLKRGRLSVVEYLQSAYTEGCTAPEIPADSKRELAVLASLRPGQPAPALSLPDINREPSLLSSHLGAKRTLVVFWASWCGHCVEMLPGLKGLWNDYRERGLGIYAVSLDKEYPAWLSSIQRNGLDWVNVSDLKGWQSAGAERYHIRATPSFYLVDERGVIVSKPANMEAVKKALEEVM